METSKRKSYLSKDIRYWKDEDISLYPLSGKTIAVIGYGIQGRAQSCNLKDSKINVIIGLHEESKSKEKAIEDGHKVMDVSQACKIADIIHMLVPDMEQGAIYKKDVEPFISEDKVLCFSHGASIHWKWIMPPSNVDVIMVSPKGPGQKVRDLYKEGFGIPALISVYQDYTKKALDIALAISKGIGSSRAGVFFTDFKEETETDCFGEQVDLCGGIQGLVTSSFETLVEAGYKPEIAYFECLYELKLIVDLIYEEGLAGMYNKVSETARYGGLTRGPVIINNETKSRMQRILKDIQSEQFAKEWIGVYAKEKKQSFEKLVKEIENHQIEKTGKEVREIISRNNLTLTESI
jgi:ketol-acid reductoisomerase